MLINDVFYVLFMMVFKQEIKYVKIFGEVDKFFDSRMIV